MDKLILVGGFHEIIELCENNDVQIIGIIDSQYNHEYCGYPILGNDSDAEDLYHKYKDIPLLIAPDKPGVRQKLYKHYSSIGYKFYTLISRKANISKSASIGEGSIIQDGVNVSSYAKINSFVKLNTNANVMHDCVIDDFATVAPNAVLLGHVRVSTKGYIGANSTILPTISIGEESIVGAGAVVTKDVANKITVVGIPAKPL